MPEGGIIPARSLRTTFSPISAWSCDLGEVELIQHQSGRFQALIVADDAILIEKGALGSGRSRKYGGNCRSLLRAGGLKKTRHGDDRQNSRQLTRSCLYSIGLPKDYGPPQDSGGYRPLSNVINTFAGRKPLASEFSVANQLPYGRGSVTH